MMAKILQNNIRDKFESYDTFDVTIKIDKNYLKYEAYIYIYIYM